MPIRTDIEDAVIVALEPLKKLALGGSASGYLHSLKVYAGEFEGLSGDSLDHLREEVRGQTPSILVGTGAGNYDEQDIRRRRATNRMTVHILIVSNCMRAMGSRTQGGLSGEDPGIWKILEDIRAKLHGNDLALDGVGQFVPQSEEAMVVSKEFHIWRQTYRVDTDAFDEVDTSGASTLVGYDSSINLHDAGDENPIVSLITGDPPPEEEP